MEWLQNKVNICILHQAPDDNQAMAFCANWGLWADFEGRPMYNALVQSQSYCGMDPGDKTGQVKVGSHLLH